MYLYIKLFNIMEQDKKLKNFIKTTIREFLNENVKTEEKYFSVTDKSGRSVKPYKLDKTHIQKHWDLDEEDWDTEKTLGDFLEDCYIGDIWNTRTEKIECVAIK